MNIVITSSHTAHYIAIDEIGEWRWTRNYHDAHRFASVEEAQTFTRENLDALEVWYLGKGDR